MVRIARTYLEREVFIEGPGIIVLGVHERIGIADVRERPERVRDRSMDVDQATLDDTRPTSCSDCAEMTASKWPLAACDRGIIQQGEPPNRSTDALATITSEAA
jgi:hypothetical protein